MSSVSDSNVCGRIECTTHANFRLTRPIFSCVSIFTVFQRVSVPKYKIPSYLQFTKALRINNDIFTNTNDSCEMGMRLRHKINMIANLRPSQQNKSICEHAIIHFARALRLRIARDLSTFCIRIHIG